jgi:hypothetical protein
MKLRITNYKLRIANYQLPALFLILLLALFAVGCQRAETEPYLETFDTAGNWGVGSDLNTIGEIVDGRYELLVRTEIDRFWTNAGRVFANGVYEVEATHIAGPIDNGYGMLFRIDDRSNSFYAFQVSSDGYIWIAYCGDGCLEERPLVQNGWFASTAVNQGLNATNRLRVHADGSNFTFYVNDQEVGRATDNAIARGDIGLAVETFGEGGVRIAFDNFSVTPLE